MMSLLRAWDTGSSASPSSEASPCVNEGGRQRRARTEANRSWWDAPASFPALLASAALGGFFFGSVILIATRALSHSSNSGSPQFDLVSWPSGKLRGMEAEGRSPTPARATVAAEAACATPVRGDPCFDAVYWAMQEGIYSKPEWYTGVTNTSTFEDFQRLLNASGRGQCLRPCEGAAAELPPRQPVTLSSQADRCYDTVPGEACYDAVKWARSDGIYANPGRYPGLTPHSSFQEFQALLASEDAGRCPHPPCMLHYPVSRNVRYRSLPKPVLKGIAYGPSPEMKRGHKLPNDDFASEEGAPLWASWGRGDLSIMRQLGANTVRLYGNDPRSDKRGFMDEAFRQGIDVIVGLSNYPYTQAKDRCERNGFNCRQIISDSYKQNLVNGLTINNGTAYHPAVKAIIVINEPDLIVNHYTGDCKAVVSALDGMLQAEKELGVTGNPVAFTVTYSLASPYGEGGIGQMNHLRWCMQNPRRHAHYEPQNDVTDAYRTRWVNGYNTPMGVGAQHGMLNHYASSSMWRKDRIPLFIGEFHAPDSNPMYDLPAMIQPAQDSRHPYFLGFAFFEFQARYDKTGGFGPAVEMKFGAYGLDRHCVMGDMSFFGKKYPVLRIVPRGSMEHALKKAFGGVGHAHEPCRRIGQTPPLAAASKPETAR
eukprot:TRINITY_DN48147_c0_g1_i1.p1 TRINITY_DN48147_c0_g1~~TRINITY_DN48147_c0_g1_i1.p1  ORF type:complete len:669 (-),score=102.12 TRINITY_DN48147_c0_g1_i1:68-2023(-)